MAAKKLKPSYRFTGLFCRMLIAGGIVFVLSGAASYFIAERMIRRPEAPAPNLLTLTLDEALDTASDEGFSLLVEKREPSSLLDEGRVLSQRPSPDMAVKQGASIRVTVATRP